MPASSVPNTADTKRDGLPLLLRKLAFQSAIFGAYRRDGDGIAPGAIPISTN